MANKEVKFSAKLDMAGLEAQLQDVKRKMQELNNPTFQMQQNTAQKMQNSGMPGTMSQQSQTAYKQAMAQNRKDMDQAIQEQARGQERLNKIIDQRINSLKRLQDAQSKMTAGSQEELKIRERIARVEENNARMKETYRRRDADLNQALDARNSSRLGFGTPFSNGGSFGAGGFGGAPPQMPGAAFGTPFGSSGRNFMQESGLGLSGILTGLAMIGTMANQVYKDMGAMPISTASNNGSATQGVYGRDVQNVFSGRSSFEQMFGGERAKAAQQALENKQISQKGEYGDILGKVALKTGLGFAAGTALPVIGNVAGTIGGFGKGVYDVWNDDRARSKILSPFSQTHEDQYSSILAKQMAQDYNTSLEGQKQQNPFKTYAVQDYEQNYSRNLNAQRMMGSSNGQFYGQGGFLRQNINQGFTPELAINMASQINAAGGSTRQTNDSVFGNQLSRGLNLTNAGSILGSISGGVGSAESTKQATVKILAEGMKLGLDDSKFAEESRRFTQTAADLISRSGANNESDFARISGNLGNYMGENTNKGVEAAKSAYEQYQQISSSTTGPRGVMRAAGFLRDNKLSQLSQIQQQALMQVPEEQLNENNTLVSGAAESLGISAKDLVSRIRGVNQGAQSRFGDADKIRNRVQSGLGKLGISNLNKDNYASLPKDLRNDLFKLQSYQTTELGYQGQREGEARLFGTINQGLGEDQALPGARENAIKERIQAPSGRMEDNTIAAAAADAGTVLTNFQGMRSEMDAAAKSAMAFTDQIRMLNAELNAAMDAAKNGKSTRPLDQTLQDILRQATQNSTQPHGGKVSK